MVLSGTIVYFIGSIRMLGKLSVLKECFFLPIGDPLGKGLYPEKNLAFFKVEFFFKFPFWT